MIIAIPQECQQGECRVAATPLSLNKLLKLGYQVHVESNAGQYSSLTNQSYSQAGAVVQVDADQLWRTADVVLKLQPPTLMEIERMKAGALAISFLWPASNIPLMEAAAARGVSLLAMDRIPRISRAQKMDALSSMANIAGYRAVIEAAGAFGSFFTGQITAAGKVPPAKVLVIGAGVAGLSAIGAARGLGAMVRAFDTRPAVKDQVKSMGAEFLEVQVEESGDGVGGYAKEMSPEFIRAEMDLFARQAREVDIIITTALVPGKPAPKLITADMVRSMKSGSVIVDLAAEQGGNCELTRPGEKYQTENRVHIIGFVDFPSRLPTQASNLYGNNIANLLSDMTPGSDGNLVIDLNDQVIRQALVVHQGKVHWPPPPLETPVPKAAGLVAISSGPTAMDRSLEKTSRSPWLWLGLGFVGALLLIGLVFEAPPGFVQRMTVFVLACLVGYQLIWNVAPALHTPLMSVTNAISGIILIGGILQMTGDWYRPAVLLSAVAVLIATINVAGGFLVTHRMLQMFRK
ncbi:MAG: Re/Si-specific NAD(P)(+) transhydrogenase subunit alpha [Pirellulaceae bacterium]|nr:Re/Si-specific NAD(P)(+) transhydrogenase subunit alpha [Pirellulaceae bacterium]